MPSEHTELRRSTPSLFSQVLFTSVRQHFKPYEDLIFKYNIIEEEFTYGQKNQIRTNQRQTKTCFKPLRDLHQRIFF